MKSKHPHPHEEVINLIKYFLYFGSSVEVYLCQLVTGWDTPQVCDSKADVVTTASFFFLKSPLRSHQDLHPLYSVSLSTSPDTPAGFSFIQGVISTIPSQICQSHPFCKGYAPYTWTPPPRITLCCLMLMDVKYLKTHGL